MSADGFNVAVNIHSTVLIKTAISFMLWHIWLCVCVYASVRASWLCSNACSLSAYLPHLCHAVYTFSSPIIEWVRRGVWNGRPRTWNNSYQGFEQLSVQWHGARRKPPWNSEVALNACQTCPWHMTSHLGELLNTQKYEPNTKIVTVLQSCCAVTVLVKIWLWKNGGMWNKV